MMYTESTKFYILNATFCNFVSDKANIKQSNNKITVVSVWYIHEIGGSAH